MHVILHKHGHYQPCLVGNLYTFATVTLLTFTCCIEHIVVYGFDTSKTVSDVGGEAMFCCVKGGHEVVTCNLFLCGLFVILTVGFLEYGYVNVVVLQDLGEDLTLWKCQPFNNELVYVE